MSHLLTVEISDKERIRVLDEIFETMDPTEEMRYIIKQVKDLSTYISDEDKGLLLARLTKLLSPQKEKSNVRISSSAPLIWAPSRK